MLQSWYSGIKNDILSKAEDKEMYGKYSYAMGSTTNKAGHYEMTLSEMHKGVEDFNELYNIAYNNKTPKNGTKEDIKNVKNLMETFEGNGIVCNVDPFNMISAIEVLGGESQSTIIRRDTKGFEEYVLSGNLQKTLEQYSEDEMKQKYLEEIFGDEAYTLSPDQLMALDCIYELDKFQAEMAKAYNDIGDDANIWKEAHIFKNSEEERNALKVSMTQDYQNI